METEKKRGVEKMSKCENCIHYDVCAELMAIHKNQTIAFVKECIGKTNGCTHFKDKSLFVEKPCEVGQAVFFYTVVDDEGGYPVFDILEGEVISFSIQKEGLWAYCRYKYGLTYWHVVDESFGKTVFLTKEDAEQKLKEGENDLKGIEKGSAQGTAL